MKEEEIWKDIPGYEDVYQASSLGNIRSLSRQILYTNGKKISKTGVILKAAKGTSGYPYVQLSFGGISIVQLVHRLIMQTFVPNPLNKREVNHINGIKTDNRLINLEWVTPSENKIHSHANGFISFKRGQYNHRSKLTNQQAREIREVYKDIPNYAELGRRYGVNGAAIRQIVLGITYKNI